MKSGPDFSEVQIIRRGKQSENLDAFRFVDPDGCGAYLAGMIGHML
jgi:hypothetical protein